jgi:hypothetical protein
MGGLLNIIRSSRAQSRDVAQRVSTSLDTNGEGRA